MTDAPHKKKKKKKGKGEKYSSNNQRRKVTVASTVQRTTMTLRWRTSKPLHNKNVGGNWS